MDRRALAERWSAEGRRYAQGINEMLTFAAEHGWDAWEGQEPEDPRDAELAERVLELLVEANASGDVDAFRREFPPAHAPFVDTLNERGICLSQNVWIDDQRLAFVRGTPWIEQQGLVLDVETEELTALEDVRGLGVCPDRVHFARAGSAGIEVRRGWDGELTAKIAWPDSWDAGKGPNRDLLDLLVFPEGDRVILVTYEGVFFASAEGARRVHPPVDPDDDEWTPHVDMVHAALAPGGQTVCVGDQMSNHNILAADGSLIGSIGRISEYPHHAAFSADGAVLAMNSCHFYDGITIAAPTARLAGLTIEEYPGVDNLPEPCIALDTGMRVYASDATEDHFLFGDANGYVRAVSVGGKDLWQHFCGSTISGIALSPNRKMLAVGSYSGMLHVVDLDRDAPDPFQIGTANHVERRRYLLWRDRGQALRW